MSELKLRPPKEREVGRVAPVVFLRAKALSFHLQRYALVGYVGAPFGSGKIAGAQTACCAPFLCQGRQGEEAPTP